MSEELAQHFITKLLKKRHRIVMNEVPSLSRCIDIVFVNECNEIISIEVKLKDWRKAIIQARDHQLVADKSYIYLPESKKGISGNLSASLKGTGIGLCVFKSDETKRHLEVEELIVATKNELVWENSRKKIKEIIYAESN